MKKSLLILFLFVFLVGCSAGVTTEEPNNLAETSVRVLSLSYENPLDDLDQRLSDQSIIQLNLSAPSLEAINYVFPGDVFTFTIELEDPDFEFVSLLSITFNGDIIRANVDDSIVSTRDCGANICIDFPVEIEQDVFDYEIEDVRFVKVNADSGVSAIIDETSNSTLTLDVYQEAVYPYVVESVNNLNQMVENAMFYQEDHVFTNETWIELTENWDRVLVIENMNPSLFYNDSVNNNDDLFTSNIGSALQVLGVINNGVFYNHSGLVEKPHVYFYYYDVMYEDIFFYNEGNSIYVDLLGESYLLIEMDTMTLIRPVVQDDFYLE